MPQIVLNKLRGVNTTRAELLLEPGVASFSQNVRNRPLTDWVKRNGIEAVSSGADPIMGIFDVELDGIIIPIIQQGANLTFYPNLATDELPNPDPYPPFDPLDASGNFVLFLVEPTMRAVQERTLRIGRAALTWPNIIFNQDGSLTNPGSPTTGVTIQSIYPNSLQNCANYFPATAGQAVFPGNNIYKYDLAYYDQYFAAPRGTYAASLVNSIVTWLTDTTNGPLVPVAVPPVSYIISNPEGASSVSSYLATTTNIGVPSAATTSNYGSTLVAAKAALRLLNAIAITGRAYSDTFGIGITQKREATESVGQTSSIAVAKASCTTNYAAASYVSDGEFIGSTEQLSGSPPNQHAYLANYKGRLYVDLTNYAGSAGYFYVKCSAVGGGSNSPPFTADGLLHYQFAVTPGTINTSGILGDQTTAFTISVNSTKGWSIGSSSAITLSGLVAVVTPNFTNHF